MIPCDLCGTGNPRTILESSRLDGPLVQCTNCGLRYTGVRRSQLAFGEGPPADVATRVAAANSDLRQLDLDEERRLALLNARWRLDLIRQLRPSGKLLEVGCARGDFLRVARQDFDVYGVEPNPELAVSAADVAPVHRGVIETLPQNEWNAFDVIASFHVIEHVDSPKRFLQTIVERMKPGGLLVLETPDINSLPFRTMKSRWRQFIPEHYYFFDRTTISRLLRECDLRIERIMRIGKHASAALIANRLSRYIPVMRYGENAAARLGLSRLTFRINPLDIMLVFGVKAED